MDASLRRLVASHSTEHVTVYQLPRPRKAVILPIRGQTRRPS